MMDFISLNGKIKVAGTPSLKQDNRSFRYGDGLFETIKVSRSKILLADLHMERLFSSLYTLGYTIPVLFTAAAIEQNILSICKKNKCEQLARVRLSVWRGNGGLYDADESLQYMVEAWPISSSLNQFNENGLVVGFYPDAYKSCDVLSNIKSSNFLQYRMAALHAKSNKWNDAIVLNQFGRIADSTIANLFLVKDQQIFTPLLKEGCINGTMRRYILQEGMSRGYSITENEIAIDDVMAADEVFLTNAIKGLTWVKHIGDKTYTNAVSQQIYSSIVQPLFL